MKDMEKKASDVWMVTGVSSGIGYEIAKYLLTKGKKVIGLVRIPEKCSKLQQEYKNQLFLYRFDLCDIENVGKTIKYVLNNHSDINYIINNAGIPMRGEVDAFEDNEIIKLIHTNFLGSMLLIKHAVSHIKKKRGKIIQISSVSGEVPAPKWSYYVASKHGINGFCESVSSELADTGAQIMIVEPGNVNTELWNKITADENDHIRNRTVETDIDVCKLSKHIINTASLEKIPLYLSVGTKCNSSIIEHLEYKLKIYKDQKAISSVADNTKRRKNKLILPQNIGDRQLVLWPVGNNLINYIKYSDWREIDYYLTFFADRDKEKVGKFLAGRKIIHPEEIIYNKEKYYIVITSKVFSDEISLKLSEAGRNTKIDFCMIDDILRGNDE